MDTAGRLHTSGSLMDEMIKNQSSNRQATSGAPQDVARARWHHRPEMQSPRQTFAEAIPITGLVVTKVDGTAKGGIVIAVHEALDVPVKFIGIGEKATDLEQFDARVFAKEVLEQ